MHDKPKEATVPFVATESSRTAGLHAAIGHFSSIDDAQKAVKALRQAGFADDAISVRQLRPQDQDGAEHPVVETGKTIVGVQAQGERAAEAWSILQNSRT